MTSAENDPGGREYVDLLPAQTHPTLRPSIHTRLAFLHPLYLRPTTFAAVLYSFQHALWNAPNMPWVPTKMPIEWDPSDQEVPCGLLGLYHSVLSHGGFDAVEAADSWRLVTEWSGGKPGVGGARKEGAKGYRETYVRYLLLFEIWARGVRVMLGHRRTWLDAILCESTMTKDAKDFVVTTWRWPDERWPMERGQGVAVVEDREWELFSESKDMLNLTWTELAIESLQVFTDPDPGGPDDPALCWNARDSSSGGGSEVPRKGVGVPPVNIDEISAGELKDLIQDWKDWENQHIPETPLYLVDDWLYRIPFTVDEVRDAPLEEYERLRRLPGPRKKPPTPPSSKEYSGEELKQIHEANPWKRDIGVEQAELVNKYGFQDHHCRLTQAFRNTEESLYHSGNVGGGWSELVGRYGLRYHKKKAAVHPCKHKDRVQLRRNRFLSYMCSGYCLSTVYEDCGPKPLTFGEYYEIHGHKSPVILKFLQERLEKEGRFKGWEFEEVERCQGSCMASPKVLGSGGSALDGGPLFGLPPSSQISRVQRSLPSSPLHLRRSTSMPEIASPAPQEYLCSDGSTFNGRLPPGLFPNHQPGELLNVQRLFPSRSLRLNGSTSMPQLAFPEYRLSDDSTSSGRIPPGLPLNHQPGEVLHAQNTQYHGYSPLSEYTPPGGTAFGEQSPQSPLPSHQVRDAQTGIPTSSLRLRRSASTPQLAFLEYQLSDGSTFSGRLPPGLFPNLQPGAVIDIQNRFRGSSSALPSFSDGVAFGERRPPAL